MTKKQLGMIVDSLLFDVAVINDFDLDTTNKHSVEAANFLLGNALQTLREEIVTKAQAATKVFIPPVAKKAEPKLPPTAVRALAIEEAA